MPSIIIIKLALLTVLPLFTYQHQEDKLIYLESWKKGKRQIQEQILNVELNANKPKYETRIKDKQGELRYKLSIKPLKPLKTNDGIGCWEIRLDGGFLNQDLFRVSKYSDPGQDYFTYEDVIGLVCVSTDQSVANSVLPTPLAPIPPILAKRVIKVESFYCVIQVMNYRAAKPGVLESLFIEITFTNSYNLNSKAAPNNGVNRSRASRFLMVPLVFGARPGYTER